MLTLKHSDTDRVVRLRVVMLLAVVETVVAETVELTVVVEKVDIEVADKVDSVLVLVALVVVSSAQKPHDVSQKCATVHVGQNRS